MVSRVWGFTFKPPPFRDLLLACKLTAGITNDLPGQRNARFDLVCALNWAKEAGTVVCTTSDDAPIHPSSRLASSWSANTENLLLDRDRSWKEQGVLSGEPGTNATLRTNGAALAPLVSKKQTARLLQTLATASSWTRVAISWVEDVQNPLSPQWPPSHGWLLPLMDLQQILGSHK